jgi:putative CocE/NonD family hydrolase
MLVPMRDGTNLALDLIVPPGTGPHPVVLIRTPYDKVLQREAPPSQVRGIPYDRTFLRRLVRNGYVLAFQDVRGRFNSDGEWCPYFSERDDGEDTIQWLAQQYWCNGNIGMIGRSYVGYTQWMAASSGLPWLKAIVPVCAQGDLFFGYPLMNGALWLGHAELAVKMGRHTYEVPRFMQSVLKGPEQYFATLPVSDLPKSAGIPSPRWWDQMVEHPNLDSYWMNGNYSTAWPSIRTPAFNITGWYDICLTGAIANFVGMRTQGATQDSREGQVLVIGPWAHWVNVGTKLSGVDFGQSAVVDLDKAILQFFDGWLKQQAKGNQHPVRVFVMGVNQWWASRKWPLPGTQWIPFYLHSTGAANGVRGGGVLSTEMPEREQPDRYRYDPLNPAGSDWSMHAGPIDDTASTDRPDVLCYTSDPLRQPLDVVGPITCVLHAASSAMDTDWHVRIADVRPDGYAQFLSSGVLRARFRESFQSPSFLTPGKAEAFRIDAGATGNRFLPGHRIRVEIASSWFPQFDRNLNSASENNFLETNPTIAQQTVFHERTRPSHVLLPVIPSETSDTERGLAW